MHFAESFKKIIFTINERNFESYCLEVFRYQYSECSVYHEYCNLLGKNPTHVIEVNQIPFLPIEFFKSHIVKSGNWHEEKVFKSSGTTQTGRSQHFVKDLDFYHLVTKRIFEDHFDSLSGLEILALLPSYHEMGDSSLIDMVDFFISQSIDSAHYLDNQQDLIQKLTKEDHQKLLLGVSYALLDLSSSYGQALKNVKIMETGGMKGRKKELTRAELHKILQKSFKIDEVYSEYGMTELLSQAYGKNGQFSFPGWAKVLIRDINDPFAIVNDGKTGGINVIDLANVDSCSFIETKDLGKAKKELFEVLGRFDNSDVRGCNLLI